MTAWWQSPLLIGSVLLTGCQIPYMINSGWQQAKLYSKRESIERVLSNSKESEETKRKLRLVLDVRSFAENELGLKRTSNYRQYVALDRPYVSYIVHAAPPFRLESYRWWFPIVGHVPYKGYFSKAEAEEEAKKFSQKNFDVFVRGVSAYSTLGWFNDPVWSSMIVYNDVDLVNTIIHETVHATLFIKNQADFNERLATFLGDFGTELFYLKKEGPASPHLVQLKDERFDQNLFSEFISREMTNVRTWYKENEALESRSKKEEKEKLLKAIQLRFTSEIKPKMKRGGYSAFAADPLNNARLLSYGTYFEDLSDFEKLRQKIGPDFKSVLAYLQNLSASKTPESDLKTFVTSPQ